MEDTKLVVCRLCLGFTSKDDSHLVDSPLKKILQDILPEINLDISHDPTICQPCNKSVLKCYEFKSSCSRDSVKEETIETEVKSEFEATGAQIQQDRKTCDFCFSVISEEAFVEFSVRKEFFNEVLQKCLPDWFQTITKHRAAVPCGTCLDDLKSHFMFIGACLTTEERIRDYCSTYGTNSKGKVSLLEVVQTNLSNIEYDPASGTDEHVVPLKAEPIDIKHEIYEGDFIESNQLERLGGTDEFAVTSDKLPATLDSNYCYKTVAGRPFLKPKAVLHVFKVLEDKYKNDRKRQNLDAPQLMFKQPKIETVPTRPQLISEQPKITTVPTTPQLTLKEPKIETVPTILVNQRSIGIQVNERDLIPRCDIGIQVDIQGEFDVMGTCSVGAEVKPPPMSHEATKYNSKVEDGVSPAEEHHVKKRTPNILRKISKKKRK